MQTKPAHEHFDLILHVDVKLVKIRISPLFDIRLFTSLIRNTCSLASHTLHKERKGLVTLRPSSCRQGTQLSNSGCIKRCWHPLNMWRNCTLWQWMWSTESADLFGHIKFLPWRQLGCSVTRPFLSAKSVGCKIIIHAHFFSYHLWEAGSIKWIS